MDTDYAETDSVESGQKERVLETKSRAEVQPFQSEVRHQPELNIEQLCSILMNHRITIKHPLTGKPRLIGKLYQ